MSYFSILDLEPPEEKFTYMPGYFWDLNLNQLLKLIQGQAPGYELGQYYYRLSAARACEDYRRQIYTDIKRPEVFACLERFSELMRRSGEFLRNWGTVEIPLQKDAWYAAAVYCYCRAVTGLQEALRQIEIRSSGLKGLFEYLETLTAGEPFQSLKEESFRIGAGMEAFRLVLVIENNCVTLTPGTVEGSYEAFLGKSLGESCSGKGPFADDLGMSVLEEELFGIYRKKYPELFDSIQEFARKFPVYADETVRQFEKEIQYYLAFYRFEKRMQERGFAFCVPDRRMDREMEAAGLYDLALACSNTLRNKPVVSNDFVYHEKEAFFVVNGPNQGGKTTFARSLGQLVYFCKMGLDVPAEYANVHDFSALLTHFSREESMEGGRGKLMEELERLAPMMEDEGKGAFVIINELFTTAAHYDGCIMGARVLRHFMDNQCRGIYVTHLKELGDEVEGVVTMTAMLEEGGSHRRTYRILRHEALESGYAEDIVEKYGLTYDRLRERLEKEKEGWE